MGIIALQFAIGGVMRKTKIMVRLNNKEKAALTATAEAKGLAIATWARLELMRIANEGIKPSSTVRESNVPYGNNNGNGTHFGLLSLFCGPGGLDEGFKQAGFKTLVGIDNDKDCINTFLTNHPESKAAVEDITKLTIEKLDKILGNTLHPVGVIGGPPCQSFSVSNVHQSENDPRHRLPEAYASLLKKLNARKPISFFVFENVPGLLSQRHIHRYEAFKRMFEQAGFKLYEKLLDAKDYGVPQERPRIIIVGINEKLHPGASWIPPKTENELKTVESAIKGLPEPVYNAPGLDPESFPVHPNHWCLVPRSTKFKNGRLEQGQMWGRSFRTLTWSKPSWTVAYGHREVHVHPEGHRRLSMYEALLLQTFPKRYRLTGNLSAQIRLVSEAVPPRLAWHIAQSIRDSLHI